MYNIELSKEELTLTIESLDSYVRFLAAKITNSNNALLELKSNIDKLTKLNIFIVELDQKIDALAPKAQSE